MYGLSHGCDSLLCANSVVLLVLILILVPVLIVVLVLILVLALVFLLVLFLGHTVKSPMICKISLFQGSVTVCTDKTLFIQSVFVLPESR